MASSPDFRPFASIAFGGQRAACVEVDAGIAEALGAELVLQLGHRRVADGDDDALADRLRDQVVEGGAAGMAHDLDAVRAWRPSPP